MSRPRGSGRVTVPEDSEEALAPLHRRRPVAFWFVVLGVFALVFATFASLFSALL